MSFRIHICKCDLIKSYVIFFTDYVVCFCIKENVEFHYNHICIFASTSRTIFKRAL